MLNIKKCSEVQKKIIFDTFKNGFSDYTIKFSMDEEFFFKRFFGPEGNSLDLSYIAMDEEKGIGLILGGIRDFDGRKTIRCGTMCVIPEMRGKGISQRLFEMHMEAAISNKCEQLFLEVIKGNDRAINFYIKNGYEKIYDLNYYICDKNDSLTNIRNDGVCEIDFDEIRDFREKFGEVHMNWQNEMEYVKETNSKFYGIKSNGKLVAAISELNSNISFLGVLDTHRKKGFAKGLLKFCFDKNSGVLSTSFPNNSRLTGFFRNCGFSKKDISQYEMYRYICFI